jgi:hypothetical protein
MSRGFVGFMWTKNSLTLSIQTDTKRKQEAADIHAYLSGIEFTFPLFQGLKIVRSIEGYILQSQNCMS